MQNLFRSKRVIAVPFSNSTGANQRGGGCDPLGNTPNGINVRATDDNPNAGMTIPVTTEVITGFNIQIVSKVDEAREVRLFDMAGWHKALNPSYGNNSPEEVSVSLGDYPNNEAALEAYYSSLALVPYKVFQVEVRSNDKMQLDKPLRYIVYNSDGTVALEKKIDPIFSSPEDRCDGRAIFKFPQELLITARLVILYQVLPNTTTNILFHNEGAIGEM